MGHKSCNYSMQGTKGEKRKGRLRPINRVYGLKTDELMQEPVTETRKTRFKWRRKHLPCSDKMHETA